MISTYCSIILMLSHNVSPFLVEVTLAVAKHIAWPLSCSMDDMKLSRVIVEGSKNKAPMILPRRRLERGVFSIALATFNTCNKSLLENSYMEIISLFLNGILKK